MAHAHDRPCVTADRRSGIRPTLGLLLLLAGAPRLWAANELALRYDVYWGVVRLLSIESHTTVDEARYRTRFAMHTVGPVGLLFSWEASSEAIGAHGPQGFQPAQYTTRSAYRRDLRHAAVDFSEQPPHVLLDPSAETLEEPPVPAEVSASTLDPNTATLELVRRVALDSGCRGTIRVFDGRRRYDLEFADGGTATLTTRRGLPYAGPARHCMATFVPVAGFKPQELPEGDRPVHFSYWFAPVAPDGSLLPIHIELSGPRGSLHAYLTALGTEPSPLP